MRSLFSVTVNSVLPQKSTFAVTAWRVFTCFFFFFQYYINYIIDEDNKLQLWWVFVKCLQHLWVLKLTQLQPPRHPHHLLFVFHVLLVVVSVLFSCCLCVFAAEASQFVHRDASSHSSVGSGLSAPADTCWRRRRGGEGGERKEWRAHRKSEGWRRSIFTAAGKTFQFSEIFNMLQPNVKYCAAQVIVFHFSKRLQLFLVLCHRKVEYQIVLQVMDISTVCWCSVDLIKKIIGVMMC